MRARDAGFDEVAGDRLGADPVLGGELAGELVEPLLAARDEHDVVTARASSRAISAPMPADAPVIRAVELAAGFGRLIAA